MPRDHPARAQAFAEAPVAVYCFEAHPHVVNTTQAPAGSLVGGRASPSAACCWWSNPCLPVLPQPARPCVWPHPAPPLLADADHRLPARSHDARRWACAERRARRRGSCTGKDPLAQHNTAAHPPDLTALNRASRSKLLQTPQPHINPPFVTVDLTAKMRSTLLSRASTVKVSAKAATKRVSAGTGTRKGGVGYR